MISRLAAECGFDLAGIARAEPLPEFDRFRQWVAAGMAGGMRYLTDRRGELRADPRYLLPTARSMVCVGKLYHPQAPPEQVEDYHLVVRRGLEQLRQRLRHAFGPFDAKWSMLKDAVSFKQKFPYALLLAALLTVGFYPRLLTDIIQRSVETTIVSRLHTGDEKHAAPNAFGATYNDVVKR